MDIKELKPVVGGHFKQGYYTPKHPEKYKNDDKRIIYRSSWEHKFMVWLDLSDEVLEWSSEPIMIKYIYVQDNKIHRYYPDFYFKYKKPNGSIKKYIVECKPSNQLKKPAEPKRRTASSIKTYNYLYECYLKNTCKRYAAKKWCEENGFLFVYLTEKSNLDFLGASRVSS